MTEITWWAEFIRWLGPYFLGFMTGVIWVGIKALPAVKNEMRYMFIRKTWLADKTLHTDDRGEPYPQTAKEWDDKIDRGIYLAAKKAKANGTKQ